MAPPLCCSPAHFPGQPLHPGLDHDPTPPFYLPHPHLARPQGSNNTQWSAPPISSCPSVVYPGPSAPNPLAWPLSPSKPPCLSGSTLLSTPPLCPTLPPLSPPSAWPGFLTLHPPSPSAPPLLPSPAPSQRRPVAHSAAHLLFGSLLSSLTTIRIIFVGLQCRREILHMHFPNVGTRRGHSHQDACPARKEPAGKANF